MIDAEEMPGAKQWVNALYDAGHYVCFFTARLTRHKQVTERWLKSHGFKFHKVLYGKPRGGHYHYVDNAHVQATTFKGRFSPLKKKTLTIEVFED